MTNHLSSYAEVIGAGAAFGALMISAAMAANIISKFGMGVLIDRIGAVPAAQLFFLVHALGCFVLALHPSGRAALMAGAFLFGTVYAFTTVGLPAVIRQVYGGAQYGRAFAAISLLTNAGNAIAISAIGRAYDVFGNYRAVLFLFTAFGVLDIVLLAVIQRKSAGQP